MPVNSRHPAETNKNTRNDVLFLSQPSTSTDLSQPINRNPNRVQIKLNYVSAALLPLFLTKSGKH